jgi:hypothetical protein
MFSIFVGFMLDLVVCLEPKEFRGGDWTTMFFQVGAVLIPRLSSAVSGIDP